MLQAMLPPTQKRPKTAKALQRKQYGNFEVIWGMKNSRFSGGTITMWCIRSRRMASRGKKIYSFRVDESTKTRFDQLVASQNTSRNKLLNHAVRYYLEETDMVN
jgi:hypothetical protein